MTYNVIARFDLDIAAPPATTYLGELVISKHTMPEQAVTQRDHLAEYGEFLVEEAVRVQSKWYGRGVRVTYEIRQFG